jgi:ABC-type transporter Mla MlaB component
MVTYERDMLRITIFETPNEQRLVVEGQLTRSAVPELELAWEKIRKRRRNCECVIDLSETSSVDSSGKAALIGMICNGARLTANGLYTEYLVQKLMKQAQEAASYRPHIVGGMDSTSGDDSDSARRCPAGKEKK